MGESNGSTPGGASSEKVIAMGGAVRFSVSLSPWASWGQSFVMRAPYRAGPSPVPGDLGVEVEGRHRGVVFVVTPLVAGDHPHDFELVAVEIMAVDRLRRSVVRLADVRADPLQRVAGGGQVGDRRDLPGQVVQPHPPRFGAGGVRSDRAQPEVVVVRRPPG